MLVISTTLLTSHAPRFRSNAAAPWNIERIVVTFPTAQSLMMEHRRIVERDVPPWNIEERAP